MRCAFWCAAVLACALAVSVAPPEFPGTGSAARLVFIPPSGIESLEGASAAISLNCSGAPTDTLIVIGSDSSATLYGACGGTASFVLDDPYTPGAVDYISVSPVDVPLAGEARVPLYAAGTVSGVILSSAGISPGTVAISCASARGAVFSANASTGVFHLPVPVGDCIANASTTAGNGSAAFSVVRGQAASVSLNVSRQQPAPEAFTAPDASALLFPLLLIAFAAFLAAFAYLFYFRTEPPPRDAGEPREGAGQSPPPPAYASAEPPPPHTPPEQPEEKAPRRKRKPELPAAAALFLAFTCLSLLSSAAVVSNSEPSATHDYDLAARIGHIPTAKDAAVTGTVSAAEQCTVRVFVGDEPARLAEVAAIDLAGEGSFSLRLASPGARRYYRVAAAGCTLVSSSILFTELPDLALGPVRAASTNASGPVQSGVPARVEVEACNLGGPLEGTGEIVIRFYAGALADADTVGEVRIGPGEPLWRATACANASVLWTPRLIGPQTLYATIAQIPSGSESTLDNNRGTLTVSVQPGPQENVTATLTAAASPSALVIPRGENSSSGALTLAASYIDTTTQQAILNASCTASANGLSSTAFELVPSGAQYAARLAVARAPLGVYEYSVRCEKEGYSPASASGVVPVNTEGGTRVELGESSGAAFGRVVLSRTALGEPSLLRVTVERAGPESIGFTRDSVTLNGYSAYSFGSDGAVDGATRWVAPGASYAEWAFDLETVAGDQLVLSFTGAVRAANGSAATATVLSVRFTSGGACIRRAPLVALSPENQSGESGTTLYYSLTVTNRDTSECEARLLTLGVREGRVGWNYTFIPGLLALANGAHTSTLLAVSPPAGESPGDYRFRAFAATEESEAAAPGRYLVSSPRMRSNLSVSVSGSNPLVFTAAYTDHSGNRIGSCRFTSMLTGGNTVTMPSTANAFALTIPSAALAPGDYAYALTCESPGFTTKSASGSLSLSSGPRSPPPTISLAPAVQSPPAEGPFALSIRIAPTTCGTGAILLAASAPEGYSAALDRDTAEGCAPTVATLTLTRVSGPSRLPAFGMVTAYAPGAPPAQARFLVLPPAAGQRAVTCAAGDARESLINREVALDPCTNWNEAHTYSLFASAADAVTVVGRTLISGCTAPVQIEFGNASGFAGHIEAPQGPGDAFYAQFSGEQFTSVRVSSACGIRESAVAATGAAAHAAPELSVGSAWFSARGRAGEPQEAAVTVYNSGASTYSQYAVSALLVSSTGETVAAGSATVYAHAAGTDSTANFSFTPPAAGDYSLFFVADAANDIAEGTESDNRLAAGSLAVSESGGGISFSRALQRGWNIIPFSVGGTYSHNCIIRAAYALDPGANGTAALPLNESSLSFSSFTAQAGYLSTHGSVERPKDASALGGAWVYSDAACTLSFSSPSAPPAAGWRSLSPGISLATLLPSDEGSSAANLLRECPGAVSWLWDARLQAWRPFSGMDSVRESDAGTVLAIRTPAACALP